VRRPGFTLKELMVAVTAISILFGLATMGLQTARVGNHRASCTNNLRNISFACINHEGTYKVLPNSGYDATSPPTYLGSSLAPGTGDRQQAGWGFQILPFIESDNHWIGGSATTLAAKQALAVSVSIPIYFCPSRRRPEVVQGRGLIDYAAASTCSGLLADIADPEVDLGTDCAIRRNRNTLDDILAGNVKTYSISLNGIKDGTANVMLISEKQMNLANEPPVADDDQGYSAGHDIDVVRTCFVPPQKDYVDQQEGPGGGNRIYRFGSSHPGVIVVAMCDGSTRVINMNIDQQVFYNLGRRRDGAKLSLD
jgi:prepilin-type N-terminal cleavage/methylation domain-containing protein